MLLVFGSGRLSGYPELHLREAGAGMILTEFSVKCVILLLHLFFPELEDQKGYWPFWVV